MVLLLWLFIKYKNMKTFFFCKKAAVLSVYLQHGNFHALLYQTIRSVWRFCYIKRRVGFCLCYHLCR